jgi:hypothetical protein
MASKATAAVQEIGVESARARFDRLKGEVLSVTPAQRRVLTALLGLEGASDTSDENKTNVGPTIDPLFYTALTSYLEAEIPAYKAPPMALVLRGSRDALNRAIEAVDTVLTNHYDCGMRQPERLACYQFCVRLVLAHMREAGIPVTLRTVIQQSANIALILDDAFPGYASANLLRVVFARVSAPKAR